MDQLVPNVIRVLLQVHTSDVPDDPVYVLAGTTQSSPGDCNRRFGHIENRQVSISVRQKIIDERGLAATDIDNGGMWTTCCSLNKGERGFQMRTMPLNASGALVE